MTGIEYEDLQRLLANPGEATGHRGDGSVGGIPVPSAEDFATAEQGAKADTAVQPDDLGAAATMSPVEVVEDPDAQAALSGAFAPLDDSLFVPAERFAIQTGSPTIWNLFPAWSLPDAGTSVVFAVVSIPKNWATFDLKTWTVNLGAGTGNVTNMRRVYAMADGEPIPAVGSSSGALLAFSGVSTAGAQDVITTSTDEGVNVPSSRKVLLYYRRTAGDAGDTLSNAFGFIGYELVPASFT